jgi:SulP family sulfate permease
LILLLERTRLGALGLVVAVGLGSALGALERFPVLQLRDITDVPSGLPAPSLPSLGMVGGLVVPALSLAFVGLVQGAAISSSVPNPDGTYPDASGDFRGQGVANIGAGLLQGMPVGGSMSATSLVTNAGARSRIALFVAGLTMVTVVLAFSELVGYIAMPALAGLLVVVGFRTLKPEQVRMVWRTGPIQAAVMTLTFILTLVIPLQYAVLVGIGMSVLLYVIRQSNRITIKSWTFTDAGVVQEGDPPAEVGANEVLVLRPYGSLFFAATGAFEEALPAVSEESRRSVVILTLRGKEDLGSTFINLTTRYAQTLADHDCLLKVSGVSDGVMSQLEVTGALAQLGADNIYLSTASLTESTRQAMRDADDWLDATASPE